MDSTFGERLYMLSKNLQKVIPYLVLCLSVAIAMLLLDPASAQASNGKAVAVVVGVVAGIIAVIGGAITAIRAKM
ncbi:hypothetical protein H6F50_18770 [Coleofasciculus sp. FACHB-712]|uniref:hypothetical protein n=1 Tax=Coleofasciculus sp. FACHB-712 TaxID=2692789 RepID=UPI001686530A|nr:hypothetical protein [Coleofasciculus sp. FACHB-712]MBD1944372.1 hypothetical protein [Coleofasciculus sp. FACHB-712]